MVYPYYLYDRFGVLITVIAKNSIFWHIKPRSHKVVDVSEECSPFIFRAEE